MATYTFTVHTGVGSVADAAVTYDGIRFDIDAAIAAGSGGGVAGTSFKVTDNDNLVAALRGARAGNGPLLDVDGTPDSVTSSHTFTHAYVRDDGVLVDGDGNPLASEGEVVAITDTDYDADGNLTSITQGGVTTTYTYLDDDVETETRGGVTRTFSYDADGNLTGAVIA